MPVSIALRVFLGYLASARRATRETASSDAGATTLEIVIIILGLIALAAALVAALTIAVNRRLEQIN